MGVGSTGEASLQLDRKFIGMEIDENYFKQAEKRLLLAKAQRELNNQKTLF